MINNFAGLNGGQFSRYRGAQNVSAIINMFKWVIKHSSTRIAVRRIYTLGLEGTRPRYSFEYGNVFRERTAPIKINEPHHASLKELAAIQYSVAHSGGKIRYKRKKLTAKLLRLKIRDITAHL